MKKTYDMEQKQDMEQTFDVDQLHNKKRLKEELRAFCREEDGIGVIEVVLILVVLIGLVIIFKKQITDLLNSIFKEINNQSKEVY